MVNRMVRMVWGAMGMIWGAIWGAVWGGVSGTVWVDDLGTVFGGRPLAAPTDDLWLPNCPLIISQHSLPNASQTAPQNAPQIIPIAP